MKLLVVAVGHRMPAWVDAGFEEYAKRMPREAALTLVEVKAEPREEGAPVARMMEAEAKRIATAVPTDAVMVALDERGKSFTTRDLAQRFADWRMEGRDIAFVIGGADGLAQSVKADAHVMWSLSPLTLPHGLVRVIVAEQLYRAYSILRNHPYHRE